MQGQRANMKQPPYTTAKAIAIAFEFLSPATQSAAPAFKALRDQLGRMLAPTPSQREAASTIGAIAGDRDKAASFTPLKRLNLPPLS